MKDVSCKSWENVVNVFFTLNKDPKLASKSDLANIFDSASHPNFFRIHANKIDQYFDTFKISSSSLEELGFEKDIDFIDDDEGLRLTFSSARKIIFQQGDKSLVEAFDFIDKIYQTFVRYELGMMNRSRRPTHWTIFKQTNKLTKSMQPQIDFPSEARGAQPTVRIMDTQPEVYAIAKGTLKSLQARITKYEKENDLYEDTKEGGNVEQPKFSHIPIVPIFETVMSNVDDEVNSFVGFLNQTYVQPHRLEQVGKTGPDGTVVATLPSTKYHMKASKTCVLIDPSQTLYKASMLTNDIEQVRSLLKYGKETHTRKPSEKKYSREFVSTKKANKKGDPDVINVVDIDTFIESKGKIIDAFRVIKLDPREDGSVSEVGKPPSATTKKPQVVIDEEEHEEEQEEEQEEEHEEEEHEEEEEEEEEKPKKKSSNAMPKSKTRKAVKEESSEEQEEEEEEEKPKKKVVKATKSKAKTRKVEREEYDTDDE